MKHLTVFYDIVRSMVAMGRGQVSPSVARPAGRMVIKYAHGNATVRPLDSAGVLAQD